MLVLCAGCINPSVAGGLQGSLPYPRSDKVKAVVWASAVALGGDTIVVTHNFYNHGASEQKIEGIVIPTGLTPVSVTTTRTELGWVPWSGIIADSVGMEWFSALDTGLVAVADTGPVFSHKAVGVLGIVKFYAQGYVPAPLSNDSLPYLYQPRLPIWLDSYKAETIAVVPFPTDMSPLGLAQRLVSLADTACAPFLDLQWVSDTQICNNSNADHRAAVQAIQAGNLALACTRMSDFVSKVDGLPNNKITSEGRALLRLNALHFRRTHCP
jgi:hypothetical protein